ncbi:MAG: histidine kinase N-terminal 7TM domain-containing protein, partial [Trueperaceae bacterium]
MTGAMAAFVVPWWTWIPTALLAVALMPLAVAAWRSPIDGARWLATFLAAAAFWCLCAAGENLTLDPDLRLAWARASYLGVMAIPPSWMGFAFRHARLRPPAWLEAALLLPAIATVALVWNAAGLPYVWSSVTPIDGPVPGALAYEHGPWFGTVVQPYALGAALVGVLALAWRGWRDRPDVDGRLPALLSAVLLPVGLHLAYRLPGPQMASFDPTPIGVGIASLLIGGLAVGRRRFEALPNAYRTVFGSLSDAVLVLDRFGRVLDLNPAAEAWLEAPRRKVRGAPLRSWASGLAEALDAVPPDVPHEVAVGDGRRVGSVEVRILPEGDDRLVTIQDVTDEVRTREALRLRGRVLEAVDALHARPIDHDPNAALASMLAAVGQAFAADGVRLLHDDGSGTGYRVHARWSAKGPGHPPFGAVHRYEDTGLEALAEAMAVARGEGRSRPEGGFVRLSERPARWAWTLHPAGRPWGAWWIDAPQRQVAPADLQDAAVIVTRGLTAWLERRSADVERRRSERVRDTLLDLTRTLLRGEVHDPWQHALEAAWHAAGRPPFAALYLRGDDDRLHRTASVGLGQAPWSPTVIEPDPGDPRASVRIRTGRAAPAGRGASLSAPVLVAAHATDDEGSVRIAALLQLDDPERSDAFGAFETSVIETFAEQVGAVVERLHLQRRSERSERAQRL